jgi:taurine dioxygenase
MSLTITPSGRACGATVTGVDLTQALAPESVIAIRQAWLEHHILAFPNQAMTDNDLERFTIAFGGFGDDPFIAPIAGRKNIIALTRKADETAPVFAGGWHTDWSFLEEPPAGTCLFGITIPPTGGDTLFANQHLAYEQLPDDLRAAVEGKMAVHSAAASYAPKGKYGLADQAGDRSMDIRPSDAALATHIHPLVRPHPETGRLGLFSTKGYIKALVDMPADASDALLDRLYQWQGRDEFVYRQKWQPNMLVMWDNRSLLHMATGGYEGHARHLHRTTIAAAKTNA